MPDQDKKQPTEQEAIERVKELSDSPQSIAVMEHYRNQSTGQEDKTGEGVKEFEQMKKDFFDRWFPYLDTTEDGNRNIGGLDWRPNFKHQTEILIGMAQKIKP